MIIVAASVKDNEEFYGMKYLGRRAYLILLIRPDEEYNDLNHHISAFFKTGEIKGIRNTVQKLFNLTKRKNMGNSEKGRILVGKNNIIIETLIVPIKNSKGKIENYLEIGYNITNKVILEKRLQQSQKLEALVTLAGGIAHDFTNILGEILGHTELAVLDIKRCGSSEKYLKEVLNGIEMEQTLVSQILTFSRKNDVELRPVKPEYVIKEALKLLRPAISAIIEIKTIIDSNLTTIAKPKQIHQIMMNLFRNAVYVIGNKAGKIKLGLNAFYADELLQIQGLV